MLVSVVHTVPALLDEVRAAAARAEDATRRVEVAVGRFEDGVHALRERVALVEASVGLGGLLLRRVL